ncbi:Pyruvate/2-oxoglutarate dehydrogenase complex, dihydrolipoamide dehydrogenase (E3) component [Meinhardsimonia xiamenensis]|jgi:pyruvate/2-oxoglutarate dehydrogenase complex dihydrolipoamide dehydrogenase (E3) component|uniref:Pyruvate/2-oxoglutarate dehydrogenase complex, dihydrolipoamide dehydrogenase (E3) component n=1 Tax=Meinhardsimonia xiamenensis TaxID=990712 RepID=A0A1G9ECD4_9RHOB|nr:FAD-dependent oxidoreductase [Meinhardsimonia xiamenensis]PRX33834.1 pyruvate/2-oxoglutarate dehydrogenase complex dihydrolipoamide dehydrogenase (E3) component [Meinhardsimonia xiamenensis]SDK73777.1 Pyruvate/2-oxoglutarate dehydrogenase complex, dihydrolipoamide dehydrogenase (E3) component [Meinhardsimonia xiamenensis]
MARINTDVCVIGAGAGGLSVAAGAAQMGARVVLVEGGRMGGDCLNYGCVPSKALLAAAKHAQAMREGARFGITPVEPEVDYAAAMEHVARTIAAIAPHDSQERFEGLGVKVIREWGRFLSPRELQAGPHVIRARRFVIATGSSPLIPPIPGLDGVPYLTNETLFDLRERPRHLIVIGGGPIGLEMAQAHRRLGAAVTVIEGMKALGREDPECGAIVLDRLRREGVEIAEHIPAEAVRLTEDGGVEVIGADGRRFAGSHLLVAVGRKANIEGLDLERAGVAHDGVIRVDRGLRTTNRRIYAIGDVAGGPMFTHVAGYHASVVIRSMLFALPSRARQEHLPWAIYTDPELAQVGLAEAQARARHGDRIEVVRVSYAQNDRAMAEGRTEGLIKVVVHRGRPVGVSIAGAQAGELASLWALAIAARLRMSHVAGMVAPYPTTMELGKRAAGAYFSPRLFDSSVVRRAVRLVQRLIP